MNLIKYFLISLTSLIKSLLNILRLIITSLITYITLIPRYIIKGIIFLIKPKKEYNSLEKEITSKIIPITILTLSIITYLISVFILTRWYVQNERSKKFTNNFNTTPIINSNYPQEDSKENNTNQDQDIITSEPSSTDIKEEKQTFDMNFININLNYYIQKNPETVAWLQVNGTNVNYPVVQHNDNDFYLEHDFYQRKTENGWIFGDYRNNFETFDNNTIIYGHNLINNTMFGSIPDLLKKSWFNTEVNHYIKLSTKNTNTLWKIFSVYKIEPTTDYLQTKFNSTSNYEEFLYKIKDRSIHKFNLELNHTDKIITLSTCDDIGTKRVVIHAKLIDIETK